MSLIRVSNVLKFIYLNFYLKSFENILKGDTGKEIVK